MADLVHEKMVAFIEAHKALLDAQDGRFSAPVIAAEPPSIEDVRENFDKALEEVKGLNSELTQAQLSQIDSVSKSVSAIPIKVR